MESMADVIIINPQKYFPAHQDGFVSLFMKQLFPSGKQRGNF
jgi:hypothetical protein